MGINSEYNGDYYFDDEWIEPGEDDGDSYPYEDFTREDFEDLYSSELLNMWFLVTEEFPRKSYQSFCNFCFGTVRQQEYRDDPPQYILSLWHALCQEGHFLLEERTVQDFFVYLYKDEY